MVRGLDGKLSLAGLVGRTLLVTEAAPAQEPLGGWGWVWGVSMRPWHCARWGEMLGAEAEVREQEQRLGAEQPRGQWVVRSRADL